MLKAKQYFLNYFGTSRCLSIPLSCVLSAHITPKANQYSPKYIGTNHFQNIPFSFLLSAHILRNISALTAAEIFYFNVY